MPTKEQMRQKTTALRQRHKHVLVEYKGGACMRCGYDGIALAFHHRDPSTKKFTISRYLTRNLQWLMVEADKCDLLCMNCHHEIEYGGVV